MFRKNIFIQNTNILLFINTKKKDLSMTWTGITSIVPRGITSHRAFRLPLDCEKIETPFF